MINEWSRDGTLRRSFRRSAPWLRAPQANDARMKIDPPAGGITRLHADSSGLLFVALYWPNKAWRWIVNGAERERFEDDFADIAIDVLDTRSGTVVATLGPMTVRDARDKMPVAFLGNSRTSYRLGETAEGFRKMTLTRYALQERR